MDGSAWVGGMKPCAGDYICVELWMEKGDVVAGLGMFVGLGIGVME